jgi:hypothetical protein
MHKYAAATSLAIALITGLALTVSASLTPANGAGPGGPIPPFTCKGGGHGCMWKCENELWSTLSDGTRNKPGSCPPLLQACIARCVKAVEATRR